MQGNNVKTALFPGFPDPAARVVQKGSNFESLLCGLSLPVLPESSWAHGYTLLTSVAVPQSSVPPILARAENTLIRTTQITICRCTRIYSYRDTTVLCRPNGHGLP